MIYKYERIKKMEEWNNKIIENIVLVLCDV